MPVGLLNIPYIQQKISAKTSQKLHEILGVEVEIGKVDFELFNKLIIKDLYLEDQNGEILFQAKRLAVGFDLLPLFKAKLRFSSAQLFSFQFNLIKETNQSPLNLQFVIDAFASKDTIKKDNNIDLVIKNLNLRRGNFTYNVKTADRSFGKFNSKHIEINDISAKIHIDELTSSKLKADINRLSFKEQSGFIVKKISLGLMASKEKASINNLEIYLPKSFLSIENIIADFKDVSKSSEYISNSSISLKINPSEIRLKDIKSFVPAFENYKDLLSVEGELSGNINHLELNNFSLTDGENLTLQADVEADSLTNIEKAQIFGIIKKSFVSATGIEKIAQNFNAKSIHFPQEILRVGNIQFEGEVSGFIHHLKTFGVFNTEVGNLNTEIEIGKDKTSFIKGKVESGGINMKKIFKNDNYGLASFNIQIDAKQNFNKKYAGKIDARIDSIEFKHYLYTNIGLVGKFTDKSFDGTFDIDCPEGKLSSKGFGELNGINSVFNFSAQAERIKLDKLNLSKKYKDSELSFDLDVNFKGDNIDNLLGIINLNNIRFSTEKGGYYLDTLSIQSTNSDNNEKLLTLNSDILNGKIEGEYSFSSIVPSVLQTGHLFFPALIKQPIKNIISPNNFSFDLTIEDTQELAFVLDLPFILYNQTKIGGKYNSISDQFSLNITSPEFDVQKMKFENCDIHLENKYSKALLSLDVTNIKNEKKNKISMNSEIFDNSTKIALFWNDKSEMYNGNFNLLTKFTTQEGNFPLKTEIQFLPSEVIFKDSIWTINQSQIVLDSTKIKVNQLRINHNDQFVNIDGVISKQPADSLLVQLNKVSLDYVFDILNIPALELGGIASGHVIANDIYHTRQLSTQLKVNDFSFNNTIIGNLDLLGLWDEEQQGIKMLGDIRKNDTTSMKVNGIIHPLAKNLSIHFNAKNTNAEFLRKYLNNVTKDISGSLTGNVHLFGKFSDVTLEGDVFVKNGSFGIDFLNTTYTFSDYVHLKPDEISIKDVVFKDKFGRQASASGIVKHNYLSDFQFALNLNASNFLVFNATEKKNPAFFGTVFGTGSVSIKGTENLVNIDVSMRSNEKTKMTLNLMDGANISEYQFINFISNKSPEQTFSIDKYFSQINSKPILMKNGLKSEIKFNLQLDATSDATIEMIMDPVSGDRIKGYGQGNIQLQYGTNSPLKLFGKYTIEKGSYNFSLQQVIHREFQIKDGSSVSFRGDPYSANLDINAIYSLTANIGDLSDNLEVPRINIPVDCILDITGDLVRPDIKFGIELPNSSEELQRQIKSIINTEDMMNRQMVYLLVLNKFYTQDNKSASTQRTNDFAAVAAATLSSQLTSLLGSISENFQIGTKFSTSNDKDFTDTEMALMLSSQLLDNRLIFNGNFGYRDNSNTNSTSFIGDFDLEYKLTKTGDFRLKAYNHYNDRYYSLRSAYTTQGLGILYRKDFNNFRNLFRRRAQQNLFSIQRDSITSYLNQDIENNFIKFK